MVPVFSTLKLQRHRQSQWRLLLDVQVCSVNFLMDFQSNTSTVLQQTHHLFTWKNICKLANTICGNYLSSLTVFQVFVTKIRSHWTQAFWLCAFTLLSTTLWKKSELSCFYEHFKMWFPENAHKRTSDWSGFCNETCTFHLWNIKFKSVNRLIIQVKILSLFTLNTFWFLFFLVTITEHLWTFEDVSCWFSRKQFQQMKNKMNKNRQKEQNNQQMSKMN